MNHKAHKKITLTILEAKKNTIKKGMNLLMD